ncbi:MAG: class I SAM-dependent methyltransferase, partial [Stackebrandtia sp.]
GYGLEIAGRTGARLLGVDFSAVALEQARRRAGELGLDATFQVGELVRTGLADDSVDAVMCVDAVQFASPPVAGLRECLRVLVPGGRLVMTCWEPAEPGDDQLPERLRGLDLDQDLRAAGFTDVRVTERPDWRHVERTLWEESLKVDAGDDRAMHSMQDEARRSLDTFDQLRRVFATATAP